MDRETVIQTTLSKARCFVRWNTYGEYRILIDRRIQPGNYVGPCPAQDSDPGYQEACEEAEDTREEVLDELRKERRPRRVTPAQARAWRLENETQED